MITRTAAAFTPTSNTMSSQAPPRWSTTRHITQVCTAPHTHFHCIHPTSCHIWFRNYIDSHITLSAKLVLATSSISLEWCNVQREIGNTIQSSNYRRHTFKFDGWALSLMFSTLFKIMIMYSTYMQVGVFLFGISGIAHIGGLPQVSPLLHWRQLVLQYATDCETVVRWFSDGKNIGG